MVKPQTIPMAFGLILQSKRDGISISIQNVQKKEFEMTETRKTILILYGALFLTSFVEIVIACI